MADLAHVVLPESDKRRILSVIDRHDKYLDARRRVRCGPLPARHARGLPPTSPTCQQAAP